MHIFFRIWSYNFIYKSYILYKSGFVNRGKIEVVWKIEYNIEVPTLLNLQETVQSTICKDDGYLTML